METLLKNKTIADGLGISVSMVYKIRQGIRLPSPNMAVALEAATGVDRRAWLWPDEFENPYVVAR